MTVSAGKPCAAAMTDTFYGLFVVFHFVFVLLFGLGGCFCLKSCYFAIFIFLLRQKELLCFLIILGRISITILN